MFGIMSVFTKSTMISVLAKIGDMINVCAKIAYVITVIAVQVDGEILLRHEDHSPITMHAETITRYSVYNFVSTEIFTRSFFRSSPVYTETDSIPRGIFQSS